MVRFEHITSDDVARCAAKIANAGSGSESMSGIANYLVNVFYDSFVDRNGAPACSLIRFFQVIPNADLPAELQALMEPNILEGVTPLQLRSLVLLATRGVNAGWNSIRNSKSHRVVQLENDENLAQMPLISRMVHELGYNLRDAEHRPYLQNELTTLETDNFKIFLVQDAKDSPFIHSQKDFVEQYGIKSVLGFGSMLPSGHLYSMIMFSRVHISDKAGEHFKVIANAVHNRVLHSKEFKSTVNSVA